MHASSCWVSCSFPGKQKCLPSHVVSTHFPITVTRWWHHATWKKKATGFCLSDVLINKSWQTLKCTSLLEKVLHCSHSLWELHACQKRYCPSYTDFLGLFPSSSNAFQGLKQSHPCWVDLESGNNSSIISPHKAKQTSWCVLFVSHGPVSNHIALGGKRSVV